jgi:hypothetical protein
LNSQKLLPENEFPKKLANPLVLSLDVAVLSPQPAIAIITARAMAR